MVTKMYMILSFKVCSSEACIIMGYMILVMCVIEVLLTPITPSNMGVIDENLRL